MVQPQQAGLGWATKVKVAVNTNILIRAVVQGDPVQGSAATRLLANASLIAIALPFLYEFVWVLRKLYYFNAGDVYLAIKALVAASKVVVNRPAVEAGLLVLDAGGDFADGVIAYEGRWLGGDTFFSFDKKAVALLAAQGQAARLP